VLNGIIQVANMIELGQIRAGIVVGTESTRDVVDNTIELLNADLSLTRSRINNVFASLTFGSASAAVLLTDRHMSSTGTRLVGATMESYSAGALLSHTDLDFSITGQVPRLLEIESARLLEEGIATTAENFDAFLRECNWSRSRMERTICHQVGARARRLLIDALGIDASRDLSTFEEYGNTGAVAIPLTLALAAERDELRPGSQIGLVGTGAGINSIIMGVEWQRLAVAATRSHNSATERPASLTAPVTRLVAEPISGLRSFDS
jgi:3-oxoacyl-[acyl-carrier-protein] synthase-3